MTTMPEATAASAAAPQNDDVLLEVRDLKMHFPAPSRELDSIVGSQPRVGGQRDRPRVVDRPDQELTLAVP